jgi:hypothetical protein
MVPSEIAKYVIIKVLLAIEGSWRWGPIGTLTYKEIEMKNEHRHCLQLWSVTKFGKLLAMLE